MNKKVLLILPALFILIVIVFVSYTFIYPALTAKTSNEKLADITQTNKQRTPAVVGANDPSKPMAEQPAEIVEPKLLRSGSFRGIKGETVSGKGSIVTFQGVNFLRLDETFNSTNGPDLYVGFGNNDMVDKTTLFARLKATSGGQNYEIPSDIDPAAYNQIYIYCKIYNHGYGIADLN